MLYGWKENLMLTNCLAEYAHLTITVSQIERDIGRKLSFSHSPLASYTLATEHSIPLDSCQHQR